MLKLRKTVCAKERGTLLYHFPRITVSLQQHIRQCSEKRLDKSEINYAHKPRAKNNLELLHRHAVSVQVYDIKLRQVNALQNAAIIRFN